METASKKRINGVNKLYKILDDYNINYRKGEQRQHQEHVLFTLTFDCELLDENGNGLGFIEYLSTDRDFTEWYLKYDEKKVAYCKSNSIPMIQIRPTENELLKIHVLTFINLLTDNELINKDLNQSISKLEKETAKLSQKYHRNNEIISFAKGVLK